MVFFRSEQRAQNAAEESETCRRGGSRDQEARGRRHFLGQNRHLEQCDGVPNAGALQGECLPADGELFFSAS